jgi:hypothetical protein
MKKILVLSLIIGSIIYFISCSNAKKTKENGNGTSTEMVSDASNPDESYDRFPDFGWMLDSSIYKGPVFKLSQDYPATMPTGKLPPFFETDFKIDWRKYLEQVQDYCFEGNTAVDFRSEDNKVRAWYHMPWQHYGASGREGFHGLTQEAPVAKYQLATSQSIDTTGAVAVGFYNDIAAYTIGQVWKNHHAPDHSKHIAFQQGAVLFKILFLSVPEKTIEAENQVPFLKNGIWWDAYVITNFNNMQKDNQAKYRRKTKVVLIQMDIMVRDSRSPTGWVLGNFQYNGKMNKPDKWKNLVPVGVMWADDPQDSTNATNLPPVKTIINPKLKETIINPDTTELPPTHLGWNSRLNGPVDNYQSSCFSCHSTAEYPYYSLMVPAWANIPPGSPKWMEWFRNINCGQPFTEGATSTDFSLQLAGSFQQFYEWKNAQGGLFDSMYIKKSGQLESVEPEEDKTAPPKKIVHKIRFQ